MFIKLWIFYILIATILFVLGLVCYVNKETIKKQFYKTFKPEKVIKVCIHFPNNYLKVFWRLLPTEDHLNIDNGKYVYNKDNLRILKNEIIYNKDNKKIIDIEGFNYDFKDMCLAKSRFEKYPEIHYIYNNALPIDFNTFLNKKSDGVTLVSLSAQHLELLKKNDLFAKLLTLETEQMLFTAVIILSIISVIGVGILVAKEFGMI